MENKPTKINNEEFLFNATCLGVTREVLDVQFTVLALANKERISAESHQGIFKSKTVAKLVFALCKKLKQPPTVRYATVELFDRFMFKHLNDLHEQITQISKPNQRTTDWQAVLQRVTSQSMLRLMTCIQIISKLYASQTTLDIPTLRRTLKQAGCSYSPQILLCSELRVLKTVGYRVNLVTPLTYVETILEIVGVMQQSCRLPVLHDLGLKVLDVVYLKRREVYTRLFLRATQKKIMKDSDWKIFHVVEKDFMLLGTGVVACVSNIVHKEEFPKVLQLLNDITGCPTEEIMDFASVLIDVIEDK